MERRTFILTSGATAIETQLAAGANDRVNVAVVGAGNRGIEHIAILARNPQVTVAAVCDVDQARIAKAVVLAQQGQAPAPKAYQTYRRLLEDRAIDAVTLATCNHWHALGAIWACQAGKDVYVESPASHNLWEGRKMVEAAAKYSRIVQVGLQGRSALHKQKAVEMLRQGVIGDVWLAKAFCHVQQARPNANSPDSAVSEGVDLDQWLGPARSFRETGNGPIATYGVHQLDMAWWGLGKRDLPGKITSTGSRFIDNQWAAFDHGNSQILFELHSHAGGREFTENIFYGTTGFMSLDADGFQVFPGENQAPGPSIQAHGERADDTAAHFANFLECLRSRCAANLNAPVETGCLSASLCHLANISRRLGRQISFDPKAENFGPDYQANQMLARDYRPPFVVPDTV